MTDLPEALPILRHNTEATFATLAGGSANHDVSGRTGACRRPAIRQLCWGDAVEAGQVAVAAAAAAAAAVEGDGEGSEWQGFDLIVVRRREGLRHCPKCHSLSICVMRHAGLCAIRKDFGRFENVRFAQETRRSHPRVHTENKQNIYRECAITGVKSVR